MLSCVWHGVCTPRTLMPSPMRNVSPCAGVRVTASQSLPPMMSILGLPSSASYTVQERSARRILQIPQRGADLRVSCFRRRGPSD